MNNLNSLELVVQPFPDGSFIVFWFQWLEIEPGVFHPVDSKTAAPDLSKLQELLATLSSDPKILVAPGENVQWQVIKTRKETLDAPTS
jgi:hypothetical protein